MTELHDGADPAAYNYTHFDEHIAEGGERATVAAFRESFHVGERAEDHRLLRLDDGAQVTLSDLWRSKPLVMEFGSFT
jgi:regulator of RNase E activity RraB